MTTLLTDSLQMQHQQHSRINLTELKTQIVKKLGPDRSKRYFYFLNRYLSHKLAKGDFDKLCVRILGRENLHLHNQLIRSVLNNACQGKSPLPVYDKEVLAKSTVLGLGRKSPLVEDGCQESRVLPVSVPGQVPHVWGNGDALPVLPRKCRTGVRDLRLRDRPSPLGPNGKTEFVIHSVATPDDGTGKIVAENGDAKLCDFQRTANHHQGLADQPENDRQHLLQRPTKRPRTKKSPDDPVSVHSTGPVEPHFTDNWEVSQQGSDNSSARSPLRAPLGIPFCSASIGGARKALPISNNNSFAVSSDSGVLFDTETLRRRMEQIVGAHGLEGVSTDCASLLNNGLDVYLKRLIRSCVELAGSRTGHESVKHLAHKQQPHGKLINGLRPHSHLQMENSGGPMDCIQESITRAPISLLDFKVAMELNPKQLGEDWPLLLEKVCLHECEE